MNSTSSHNASIAVGLSMPPLLNGAQALAIESIERVMSVLSMLGCLIIITSFLLVETLRVKAFNRLLFFASFGNLLSSVATVIGTAGVKAGPSSATCKTQATLIQWFLPADCLWTFCMALNVFLTFQTSTMAVDLRKMEKWYFLFCYGVPAVPALTYLMLDVTRGTEYYGNATLWCWLAKQHDSLRLSTFYGPVWVVILVTMSLYASTGRAIYKGQVRNRLMQYALSHDEPSSARKVHTISPTRNFNVTASTEIFQISKPRSRATSSDSSPRMLDPSIDSPFEVPNHIKFMPVKGQQLENGSNLPQEEANEEQATSSLPTTPPFAAPSVRLAISSRSNSYAASEIDCNSIKVTTTITSHSIRWPGQAYLTRHRTSSFPLQQPSFRPFQARVNRGARRYAQVAFLLYLAMLAVWVPSTINRVWGRVNPNNINFPLTVAAALVLPLQGFFNTLIYLFTSRHEISKQIRRRRSAVSPASIADGTSNELPRSRCATSNSWHRARSRSELVMMEDGVNEDIENLRFPWHGQKKEVQVEEHIA